MSGASTNSSFNSKLDIARGLVGGQSVVNKFGRNNNIAIGVEEEIWDGSIAYTFPATALMTSISQTTDQTAMRGETIEVQGLDTNWDFVVQDPVLDATLTTNVVTLTTPLRRCFRMKVASSVVADSTIRVHNAAESQDYAIITAGEQQTHMAIYTIPNGQTGYMTNYYSHVNPGTNLDPTSMAIRLWATDNENGYARQLKHIIGQIEGNWQHEFDPYRKFTQKTDIFITATPVGKAADVSAGFDIILIEN